MALDVFYTDGANGPFVQSFADEDAAKLFRREHRTNIIENGESVYVDEDGSVTDAPEGPEDADTRQLDSVNGETTDSASRAVIEDDDSAPDAEAPADDDGPETPETAGPLAPVQPDVSPQQGAAEAGDGTTASGSATA